MENELIITCTVYNVIKRTKRENIHGNTKEMDK